MGNNALRKKTFPSVFVQLVIPKGNVVYPVEQSSPWRLVNVLFDESEVGLLGDVVSILLVSLAETFPATDTF